MVRARRRDLSVAEARAHDRGNGGGVLGLVRERRSVRRSLRSRSCTAAACSTTRRSCRRSSAHSRVTSCYLSSVGCGRGPGVEHPGCRPALRARTCFWAAAAGVRGAAIAVGFTYLTLGLRRTFRMLPRACADRRWTRPRRACVLVPVHADVRRSTDRLCPRRTHRVSVCSWSRSSPSCWRRRSRCRPDWPGGFIIPLFFLGATMGQIAHQHVFAARRRRRVRGR